jgi:TolA-binding protein
MQKRWDDKLKLTKGNKMSKSKKKAKKAKSKLIGLFNRQQSKIDDMASQIEKYQDMIEECQCRNFADKNMIESLESSLKSAESALSVRDAAENATATFVKKVFDS